MANHGGAVHVKGNASVTLLHSLFEYNSAKIQGGALWASTGDAQTVSIDATILACTFRLSKPFSLGCSMDVARAFARPLSQGQHVFAFT